LATATDTSREQEFSAFLAESEPRLRRLLISRYGSEVGREAAAEAFAYGWEHWGRLRSMKNPIGYLFRVAQSRSRRFRFKKERPSSNPVAESNPEPWIEPALADALQGLSPRQRAAVMMIHGYGHTYEETASAMGVSRSTIQRHVERGMAKLRIDLEVGDV
jgi:RNA polymerase sigma factor (sigma-70 family)